MATTKFCFPLYCLATGITMSSKTASSRRWYLVLAARWELSWVVNQKPLFSSTWVSLGGYLGFAEHNGWGPIRNVPSCRFLKAQTQKCSKSPLLYYIGPRVSKHRLCLLKGVEMSHFHKIHGKGDSVVVIFPNTVHPLQAGQALPFHETTATEFWYFYVLHLWIY